MESIKSYESDHLNLKATELRLGLPGIDDQEKQTVSGPKSNKRSLPDEVSEEKGCPDGESVQLRGPAKAQIVGWPPIRSYRKNSLQVKKSEGETTGPSGNYLKVSRDGAPYLRKIDLVVYNGYAELLKSLESMFKFNLEDYSEREGYGGSEYVPTYEDKDGDWMLVGDVPWEMFMSSCKRLRIMKGPEARGLGCGV